MAHSPAVPGPGALQSLRETCHDMRQPVASVLALAAAALAEPGVPAPARGRLRQITEQAVWLADLIQHTLEGTRSTALGAGVADLQRIVSEAAAAECLTWPGEARLAEQRWGVLVPVHPVLLRRMAANLLGNAMRAAGPAGTVTAAVSVDGDCAVLTVEDTGPGFGKIEPGRGLGLSLVARNAARHGGGIEVGDAPGGGVRARLRLPLSREAAHHEHVVIRRLQTVWGGEECTGPGP